MSGNLRELLEDVRAQRGSLTRSAVVEAARPDDSPLHAFFEWDDTVAAERWRLEQAGRLLHVHFRPDPTRPRDLRAFVAVAGRDSPRAEYVPTDEAMADPFTRNLVLQQMEREWRAFKRRYSHMAEYAALLSREVEQQTAS